ncbi:MAG: asparagine synthase (glutamine-hydrolyzing) [Proteobacteria bacterium]|nr:asparagine synthase (glutamine-hydrolyzing) [Pseudomonadota bacterium]
MCGIAGMLDWRGRDRTGCVSRMTARLARRGPDAGNVVALGPATLGHRRLSVLDLSTVADQPMADPAGRYWIVYNGEIYNFRELRAELARAGAVFRGTGDTEVLLAAYMHWGSDCVSRLNGMFAFAIWDGAARTLLLARDRAGEKPLYYARTPGGFAFASQLDALLEDEAIARRVDPQALGGFLDNNYVTGANAIIAGVHRLPPAHTLLVGPDAQNGEPRRYWSLAAHFEASKAPRDDDDAADELRALVDDAVRLRMVSDVPLGAFLSGGVDSSTVVGSMVAAGGSQQPRTFCMGFDDAAFDESAAAADIAAHLGTVHRQRAARGDADAMEECLAAWDEPFADSSMLPTYELARFARTQVTVALSGDGGDELFAGYDTYVADRVRLAFDWMPAVLDGPAAALLRAVRRPTRGKVAWDEKLGRFLAARGEDFAAAHVGWRRIFSGAEKRALLRPAWQSAAGFDPAERARGLAAEVAGAHPLDQAMHIDIATWLPDDVLTKVDRATMAWSLEARAPFLDHRLIEFAARLPVDMKMRGLKRKWLLKHSQRARLPAATLARRKAGFSSPVANWATHWRRHPIYGHSAKLAGDFFEPAAVEALWQAHLSGRADNGLKLFGLIALREWAGRMGLAGI